MDLPSLYIWPNAKTMAVPCALIARTNCNIIHGGKPIFFRFRGYLLSTFNYGRSAGYALHLISDMAFAVSMIFCPIRAIIRLTNWPDLRIAGCTVRETAYSAKLKDLRQLTRTRIGCRASFS